MSAGFRIELSEEDTGGAFEVYVDGDDRPKGTMTFSKAGSAIWIIDHTEVRPELKGTGVAATLVRHGVETARARGLKVIPLCPYARVQFERHPEYRDVLK